MSPLASLHQRLTLFRRHRQRLRWGMAWSALAIALLIALGILFAADVAFHLSVPQRVVVILLLLAAVAWATNRFVRAWLGVRETETDVALFVEREHGIDSDLVAALEFDRRLGQAGSSSWGSLELQAAVISRVAGYGEQLDLARGMDYRPLSRRLKAFGAAVVAWCAVAALLPDHVGVFFHRLLLSARHYPSSTTIQRIAVNRATVWDSTLEGQRPRDSRSGKNRPVAFEIRATGVLPESGSIECRSRHSGALRRLALRRADGGFDGSGLQPPPVDTAAAGSVLFVAELPRLIEELDYTIRLGDTWTDPARVELIEPPVVDLAVIVTPPTYAESAGGIQSSAQRQHSVLEGSRVEFQLACVNGKPLESASVRLTAGGETKDWSLVSSSPSKERLRWSLPAGTPLQQVTQEIRYEIQVVDRDGLGLESPLQGTIRLKVDRPPTAFAAMVHRVVLPTATPVLEYRLNDDFGIAAAGVRVQVERAAGMSNSAVPSSAVSNSAGSNSAGSQEVADEEIVRFDIPLDPAPISSQNLPRSGRLSMPLSPLNLVPGDQLKLTLSVIDYRGEQVGRIESSEPILLRISDEAGVLSAITEADERSDKRLDEVIKQQLGVGGNR